VVGWFGDLRAMNAVYDEYRGASGIVAGEDGFEVK
jgi:hypothetical protein